MATWTNVSILTAACCRRLAFVCRFRATMPLVLCVAWLGVGLSGCVNQAEIATARTSVYATDFANVFNAVRDAVRRGYPNFTEDPGRGVVRTAWHQVRYSNQAEDPRAATMASQAQGFVNPNTQAPTASATTTTRGVYKRFFIRFDITIVGTNPYRVRVNAKAAEWEPGMAVPSELKGAAVPTWLSGRIDAMHVAIYRQLKSVAQKDVTVERDAPHSAPPRPRTAPASIVGVPTGAATALAALRDALVARDYAAARAWFHQEVIWTDGAPGGIDAAFAYWQADPTQFDAMQKAIGAGCVTVADTVTCGQALGHALVVQARAGKWQVSAFAANPNPPTAPPDDPNLTGN